MKLLKLLKENDETPFARPKQKYTILVEPMQNDQFWRARIEKIGEETYGSKPYHPQEFMGTGKTPGEAIFELGKKMKR